MSHCPAVFHQTSDWESSDLESCCYCLLRLLHTQVPKPTTQQLDLLPLATQRRCAWVHINMQLPPRAPFLLLGGGGGLDPHGFIPTS
jgi:hypothetical protein